MADKIKIDVGVLRDFVAQYKANFNEYRAKEIYKWKAVKCFQDNWNIEAEDFHSMLKASLAKTSNLFVAMNFFPRQTILGFAEFAPDEVRSMFRELFDESIDLRRRVREFDERSAKLLLLDPGKPKNHYQKPNAISTYLWLRYPDKYYIFKNSITKDNAQKLYGVNMPPYPSSPYDRMIFGYELYDAIREELAKDSELLEMSKNNLNPADCYPDEGLKTLTIDMGYFISTHTVSQSPPVAPPKHTGKIDIDKNIILYGPPGTGKTYSTVLYAVSIIEERELDDVKKENYKDVFKRYQDYKDDDQIAFTTFHQSYGYEEFIEGIRPKIAIDGSNDIEYEIRDGVFKTFCNNAVTPTESGGDPVTSNRVFIIDEINRGNISKIFGELITLIEPSKRIGAPEGQTVRLPYSDQEFGVPENVFIIGTMNTADRSIAMIDTALRRRFSFVEMQPKSSLLHGVMVNNSIDIAKMLDTMNERIAVLLDREHTIGHSYFLPLKKDDSIGKLAGIFEKKIIPLLQEYFFDDYEKIQLVLGDNQKKDNRFRFIVEKSETAKLFGDAEIDRPKYYEINREAFKEKDAYDFLK